MSVRTKFILILLLAGAMPIFIGLMSIRVLGHRDLEKNKGQLFQVTAEHIAGNLDNRIQDQVNALDEFLRVSDLAQVLGEQSSPDLSVDAYETQWSSWGKDHPRIHPFLNGPLAVRLYQFCQRHPLYAEAFITDREGRLRAATNKTSDYFQADEEWWNKAFQLSPGEALIEGIHFDESADVYSLDVALPIWGDSSEATPVGVMKGVLDASPLFSEYRERRGADPPRVHVIQEEGQILAGLFGERVAPLEDTILPEAAKAFFSQAAGWLRVNVDSERPELAGFSRLKEGDPALAVIVHQDLEQVRSAIRAGLFALILSGVVLAILFTLFGVYIADRKIIRPLRILSGAAHSISATAGLQEDSAYLDQANERVVEVSAIRTGDEIEELARDFGYMAKRVLRYHEQLETEIALKTDEITRDQQMAREFQQALLPSQYPEFPDENAPSVIRLTFHHTYKPTLSVGGDFFDVTKLSPNRAGIFIADVMGHGARSALITAILRTLLHNLAPTATDPANLLTLMNKRFYESLPNKDDCIFATACYLVIDTSDGIIHYAYAGHPAPLLSRKETGTVAPLPTSLECQSALGLLADTVYSPLTAEFQPGDVVVLYTDGVIEAPNPDHEEFGEERLCEVLRHHNHLGADGMTDEVMQALHRFMDTVVSPDDICVVAIEALEANDE